MAVGRGKNAILTPTMLFRSNPSLKKCLWCFPCFSSVVNFLFCFFVLFLCVNLLVLSD